MEGRGGEGEGEKKRSDMDLSTSPALFLVLGKIEKGGRGEVAEGRFICYICRKGPSEKERGGERKEAALSAR